MPENNELGIKPVYTYFFEKHLPGTGKYMFHGDELQYAFGCLERCDIRWEESDLEMKDALVDYITNFAQTGNPNGQSHPEWKPYTANEPVTMYFSDNGFGSEEIGADEKTQKVVSYLLERPGMLDDSFF